MEKYSQVIFDKNTVEFVTVAAEYCGFLERTRDAKRGIFVDTALNALFKSIHDTSLRTNRGV